MTDEEKSGRHPDDQKEEKETAGGQGDKTARQGESRNPPENERPKRTPLYKRHGFIPVVSVLAVLIIGGLVIIWLIERKYVSTDDAYIDGHVTQVSARVSSQVTALRIVDNELVHKGQLLIELDPTTFEVSLAQARAQVLSSEGKLAQARAQIGTAKAGVTRAKAQMDAAQVQFENADRDLKRYQEVDQRARSRQQLDNASTREKNARAQLEQASARETSAQADLVSANAAVKAAQGQVETSMANEKSAEVNLSYCKIYASVEGRVTERTVEVGNYVAPGQALFMLVDPNVWVTANFKETKLARMRPGQPVSIQVDAFPGKKWRGHVDSIQAGSGERFSVLPAENATGNFVKVVQRVPVKIIFDAGPNTNDAPMLSPGLSVEATVKVR